MARFKSVIRHSGYLFGSKLISRAIFTAFSLYAAVRLGPSLFGMLTFTLATVELINTFGDLGLTRYGTRELVRHWSDRATIGGELMVLQVGSSIVFAAAAAAIVLAADPGSERSTLLLIGMLSVIAWGAVSATESLLVASESFSASAIFSLLGRFVFVAAGAAAIALDMSVVFVMLAFLAGVVFEVITRIAWVSVKLTRLSMVFPRRNLLRMLRATAPFAASAFASVAMFQAGAVILGLLRSDEVVGIYGVAFSLYLPIMWTPVILARTIFPGLAALYERDEGAARMNSWQWYRVIAIIGIPFAVLVTMLAGPILSFMPDVYLQSADVLIVLVWALPFNLLAAIEVNILQVTDREISAARIQIISATVTVVLLFVLIPPFGAMGPALAYLAGCIAREVQIYFDIYRHFMFKHMYTLFIRPLFGGLVMMAAALLVDPAGPWIAAVAACLAYVTVMLLTRAVQVTEVRGMMRS